MFKPVPYIRSRPLLNYPLISVQNHVDSNISVSMNTYLETVSMSVFNRFMNLLLSHGKNPVIIGPALVWSAHSHGSLRSRAIRTIFNTTDFEFFITKAGIKSRFFKIIIQILSTDHHIDSEPHLISIIGISIGYHVVSARSSVMNGCQA